METIVVGEFKLTGINKIDIDLVRSKWSHLWWIYENKGNEAWRLIKYVRKDSPNTEIKMDISETQAKELIDKLNLIVESIMGRSFSWRRQEDVDYLDNWRKTKYNNNSKRSSQVSETKINCPDCYGEGEITTSHEFKHCKTCNGSGKVKLK